MNVVKELKVKVYLSKDIIVKDVLSSIGNLIDKSFAYSDEYSAFHKSNQYKNYTFNMLFPLESDKLYKQGNIYTFIIRTCDNNLSQYFIKYLINIYTDQMKVLSIEKRNIPKKYIDEIFSITPIVIKFDQGYWRTHASIDTFERRITENLIKKYNAFYNTKIQEGFDLFTAYEIKNKKPISVNYKDISFLGDKLQYKVSSEPIAQELVYFAIAVGLGEIGSRGFGFINYRYA